jgi:aldehyde:ferredoxin oxidoreductase
MQRWMAAMDALGLCMMIGMPIMEEKDLKMDLNVIGCVSALTGETLKDTYILDLGKSVLEIERKFNKAAGLTKEDDRLPKFFSEEKFGPGQFVFDVPESELDTVHES